MDERSSDDLGAQGSEIFAFIEAYRAACAAMDASAVCASYEYPCLIGLSDSQFSYADAPAMRPAMEWVLSGHLKMGVTTTQIDNIEIQILSKTYAKVDLDWLLRNDRMDEIATIPCSYVLRRLNDTWKIVFAVSHAEDRASADRANAGPSRA